MPVTSLTNRQQQNNKDPLDTLFNLIPALERLEAFVNKKRGEEKLLEYSQRVGDMFNSITDKEGLISSYKGFISEVIKDPSIPTEYKSSILSLGETFVNLKQKQLEAGENKAIEKITDEFIETEGNKIFYKTKDGVKSLSELINEYKQKLINEYKQTSSNLSTNKIYSTIVSNFKNFILEPKTTVNILPIDDKNKDKYQLKAVIKNVYYDPITNEEIADNKLPTFEKALGIKRNKDRTITLYDLETNQPYQGLYSEGAIKEAEDKFREQDQERERQEIRYSTNSVTLPPNLEYVDKNGNKLPITNAYYTTGLTPQGEVINEKYYTFTWDGKKKTRTEIYVKDNGKIRPLLTSDLGGVTASNKAQANIYQSISKTISDFYDVYAQGEGAAETNMYNYYLDEAPEKERTGFVFSKETVNKLKEYGLIRPSAQNTSRITFAHLGPLSSSAEIGGDDAYKDKKNYFITNLMEFLQNPEIDYKIKEDFVIKSIQFLTSYNKYLSNRGGSLYTTNLIKLLEELKKTLKDTSSFNSSNQSNNTVREIPGL